MSGPFKLKSGNSPLAQSKFGGKKINLGKGISKFFGDLSRTIKPVTEKVQEGIHKVASDVSKVSKIDVPKKFAGDVRKVVKKVEATVNPGSKRGVSKGNKAKRKAGESQYQANVRVRRESK